MITVDTVNVTPEMAQEWLDKFNTRNRAISRSKVNLYKNDIKQGNWSLTHQGIAFYVNKELADGQHRLKAIAEAGIPVKTIIMRNLPMGVGADIDRHKTRTEADAIRIGDLSEWIASQEIQVIKMIIMCHKGRVSTYSPREIAEIGELMRNEVEFSIKAFPKRVKYITTGPMYAALAIASLYEDNKRLLEFAEVMATGMARSPDDVAAIKLREQLIREGAVNGQQNRRRSVKRVMRAIKAFCDRQQIERLFTPEHMIYSIPDVEEII